MEKEKKMIANTKIVANTMIMEQDQLKYGKGKDGQGAKRHFEYNRSSQLPLATTDMDRSMKEI